MTILLYNKTLFSTTVPASTQATIATYDLATGGKGDTNADNVIIPVTVRINQHSASNHGYQEVFGLFTRIGGTLSGPFAGAFPIVKMNDTVIAAGISFDFSGSQILVLANAGAPEAAVLSGVLEIFLVD